MKLFCLLMTLFACLANASNVVPNEFIVKLKKNSSMLKSLEGNPNVESYKEIEALNLKFLVVKVKNASKLDFISQNPAVEYVEPNYIWKAVGFSEAPNDSRFDELWGLNNTGDNAPQNLNSRTLGVEGADINALKAWDITKGSKEVRIAVIDTGIDYTHEDLAGNIWVNEAELNGEEGVDDDNNGYIDDIHGYDFANNDGDPMDDHNHGTHCAGTIGAIHNNELGVAGVMANVKLVPVKFLSGSGSGSTEGAIRSIEYATKLGVDIMSNSWGGGGYSRALLEAIQAANEEGIIFVAAAGNSASDNNSRPHYPSNYEVDNVISVAAHNASNNLASFSCYGSRTVHVAAPGRNILSTVRGGYAVYSGTSMATPHVAGVVGLYLSQHGKTSPLDVRNKIMNSSVYGKAYDRTTVSRGRVDAYNFLMNIVTEKPVPPSDEDWLSDSSQAWESEHDYQNNYRDSRAFNVSGAKYLRAVFERIDLERTYDTLKLYQGNELVETISGSHEGEYITDYVEGSSLRIDFQTDQSNTRWGFKLKEIQYILE